MITSRLEIDLDAPIQRVWDVLADYDGYAKLPHISFARVVEKGKDDPAGIGTVRELSMHLTVIDFKVRERIVEFEPLHHISYKIEKIRPFLLVHEIGRMQVSEKDGKTHLLWETTFTMRVPLIGDLLAYPTRAVMNLSFEDILHALKADIEGRPRETKKKSFVKRVLGGIGTT